MCINFTIAVILYLSKNTTHQGRICMGTYNINYEEVNAEIRRLRNHLASSVINPSEREYRQIQTTLRQVDGAATAEFQEAMNENREKTVAAAMTLERLLSFISNTSRQIQTSENQIARSFNIIRR